MMDKEIEEHVHCINANVACRTLTCLEQAEKVASFLRFNNTLIQMAEKIKEQMNVKQFNGLHLRSALLIITLSCCMST